MIMLEVHTKLGDIEQLFKVPQEIYDSEYGKVGAPSLKILRYWIF